MLRVLTSSNRALAQRAIRSTLTLTRAASSDPEAGSVAGGQDAFGKREKAEETRWARRFEAEQAQKYRAGQNQAGKGGNQPRGNAQGAGQQGYSSSANQSVEQRLAELEAQKRQIDQEINELRRQKS